MLSYGTAGFRGEASTLHEIMKRCGMLMGARGINGGIMITASHNVYTDNGVKLIDANGEMIDDLWEQRVTALVNAGDKELSYIINSIKKKNETIVYIGYDTRASSLDLCNTCIEGVVSVGGTPVVVGHMTTPQFQYCVLNKGEDVYTQNLLESFSMIYKKKNTVVNIDCANGVGTFPLQRMMPKLKEMGVDIVLYNTGDGTLNHECGSDYIEKTGKFPSNMQEIEEGSLCFSIDGDADRVICFTKKNGKLLVLNGDRISALMGKFFGKSNVGIVQTAFSNGASAKYLQGRGYKVEYAKTGVKHLHRKAKNYDIGVYFEPNGHGSVLFNSENHFWNPYKLLLSQVTGDAIGNILMILHILSSSYGFEEWIQMYDDFPSFQTNISTKNKHNVVISEVDETVCLKPEGLQEFINNECLLKNGRAFVRPSGTEDVVRIYAEAPTVDGARLLLDAICQKVTEVVTSA